MIRFLITFFVLLFPQFSCAATELDPRNLPGIFSVSVTDKSMAFLRQLFGDVGGLLHGGGDQILGHVFRVFNLGIWVMAGVFVVYTTFLTVVNTAKEGEFMGRQMSSWVVVRTVGGIAALLPKFGAGYSFVQVVVMWAIVQGIGFADHTWIRALEYIEDGGVIFHKSAEGAGTDQEKKELGAAIDMASNVLRSSVCFLALDESTYRIKRSLDQTYFRRGIQSLSSDTNIRFGSAEHPSLCGEYGYVVSDSSVDAMYRPFKKLGMEGLALDMLSLGRTLMFERTVQDVSRCATDAALQNGSYCTESMAIYTAAASYLSAVRSARLRQASQNSKRVTDFTQSKRDGWIMAALDYYNLTRQENRVEQLDKTSAHYMPEKKQSAPQKLSQEERKLFIDNLYSQMQNVNTPIARYTQQAHDLVDLIYAKPKKISKNRIAAIQSAGTLSGGGTAFDNVTNDIKHMIQSVVNKWLAVNMPASEKNKQLYQDPVARLRDLGLGMISATITFWSDASRHAFDILTGTAVTSQVILMGAAAGFSLLPGGDALATAMSSAFSMAFQIIMAKVFWFLPLGIAMSAPLFLMGATLGVYAPLIPFIIFTFSAIGWFVSVVESMVAAPLVALGMTHPEGHDLMGKSEQALMLLLSVFLRPVSMVIGLLVGIVLAFVGLELLNNGFFVLMQQQMDIYNQLLSGSAVDIFVVLSAMLLIYTLVVLALISQSFAVIYLLGDKLVRWVGGAPEQSMVPGVMQEVRGGYEQGMREGAGGAGQMVSGVRSAGIAPSGVKAREKSDANANAGAAVERAD